MTRWGGVDSYVDEAVEERMSGYLPLTGGTMTAKEVYWNSGKSAIMDDGNVFIFNTYPTAKDSNNRRSCQIANRDYISDVSKALRFIDVIDGNATLYQIYGEHNYPTTVSLTGAVSGSSTFSGKTTGSITTYRRYAVVGQNDSTTTNPWYKVAEYNCTIKNSDPQIIFYVTDTYSSFASGILKCHVRTDASVNYHASQSYFRWLVNDGFTASDFVLAYKNSDDNTYCHFEIWTKVATAWRFRKFVVLSEGTRTAADANTWTLYTQTSAGYASEVSSDHTQVVSTSNMTYGTSSLTAGSSSLSTGTIYYQYE